MVLNFNHGVLITPSILRREILGQFPKPQLRDHFLNVVRLIADKGGSFQESGADRSQIVQRANLLLYFCQAGLNGSQLGIERGTDGLSPQSMLYRLQLLLYIADAPTKGSCSIPRLNVLNCGLCRRAGCTGGTIDSQQPSNLLGLFAQVFKVALDSRILLLITNFRLLDRLHRTRHTDPLLLNPALLPQGRPACAFEVHEDITKMRPFQTK